MSENGCNGYFLCEEGAGWGTLQKSHFMYVRWLGPAPASWHLTDTAGNDLLKKRYSASYSEGLERSENCHGRT